MFTQIQSDICCSLFNICNISFPFVSTLLAYITIPPPPKKKKKFANEIKKINYNIYMNAVTIRNYKIIQILAPCMKMVRKGSLIHLPSGTVG